MYFSFTCKLLVHIFPTSKLPIPPLSSKQHEVFKKTTSQPHPQTPKTNNKINKPKNKPRRTNEKNPSMLSCPSSTAAPPTPSNQLVVSDSETGPTTRF